MKITKKGYTSDHKRFTEIFQRKKKTRIEYAKN